VVKHSAGCELRIVELAKAFPCGSTLEVKLIGDRLYLDGEASSIEEWRVLFEVLKRYPSVILLGHLKPQVIEQEFRAADAGLQAAGLTRAHWTRAGDTVLLEGEVPEDQQPTLRAVDEIWRPRLELVLRRASEPRDGG
jgi:pilus assembly protein CpaC